MRYPRPPLAASPSCRSRLNGCSARSAPDDHDAEPRLHAERPAVPRRCAGALHRARPRPRRAVARRYQGRVRRRGLRLVHGPAGRSAHPRVLGAVDARCGTFADDDRRPRGWQARSSAGRLREAWRLSVRVLHARHDPVGSRAPDRESSAERPRGSRGARWEPVPVHGLRQDRGRGPRRRSRHARAAHGIGRVRVSQTRPTSFECRLCRRNPIPGGGFGGGRRGPLRVNMRLRPFELIEPDSVDEAVAAFAREGDAARIVSGGTALVPMIRLGLLRPDPLITLHRVPGLVDVRIANGTLHLGAMVSMADLSRSPMVRGRWKLLAEAAGRVATPAIRTSATVGGNLAYAEAASDGAAALLCLEASVETAGPGGDRSAPITSFFTGFYE